MRRPPHLRLKEGSDSDPPSDAREALIDEAIALFGPRYRREITRDEAGRMVDRLTAFFGLLADWDRRAGGEDAERENAA